MSGPISTITLSRGKTMDQEEAVRQALARSYLYCILSPLFLYPGEVTFSGLNWGEGEEAVALLGSPDGLKEAIESLKGCLETPGDLQSEYGRVFGHTISKECPPYETQYGGTHDTSNIFQQAQVLADIAGFYRAFGLEASDQVKERLDHISIELEFMAFLTYKQAHALTSGWEDKAEVCREAQAKFLNDHLGQWVPLFTTRLSENAGDGFYWELSRLTKAFLDFDVKAMGAKPCESGEPTPVTFEPEESCFSCGIKDL